MTSTSETLLSRLDSVSQRSPGRWFARCPSHDDSRPSLSVQECNDGTLLVHCFAGCGAADICAAIGLSLSDLFANRPPDQEGRPYRKRRPILSARDVIDALDHESLIVAAIAADIVAGKPLAPEDLERVNAARDRISRIAEVVR